MGKMLSNLRHGVVTDWFLLVLAILAKLLLDKAWNLWFLREERKIYHYTSPLLTPYLQADVSDYDLDVKGRI